MLFGLYAVRISSCQILSFLQCEPSDAGAPQMDGHPELPENGDLYSFVPIESSPSPSCPAIGMVLQMLLAASSEILGLWMAVSRLIICVL
ncbi:hypothetical protein GUJ93_ZPchr0007g5020 [Zizania palustris]|uniref:Uncharacterized protein n=1 Tax=Zizania palustris TaxID=103762 RepID=A0A8J5VPI8_ZIZPA|nr:hypothetical protein GUJ93_ZPchr0007g5020 [Zizania palustris]